MKVAFIEAADAALDFAGTYTMQDADATGKDITLNKHKFVSWSLTDTDRNAYDWEAADQDWEGLRMATYAAMVHSMDREIGRLLATLDELGIADDTLVLFLSDNGGCAKEHGSHDVN